MTHLDRIPSPQLVALALRLALLVRSPLPPRVRACYMRTIRRAEDILTIRMLSAAEPR